MRNLCALLVGLMLVACEPGGELGSAPPPPQPIASAGDGSVRITWNPVAGAAAYRLYWLDSPSASKQVVTPPREVSSPAVIGNLENGRTYYLALTSVGAGGESELSAVATVTPTPVPAAPRDIEVSTAAEAVTLTWPAVSGADSYRVYVVRGTDVPPEGAAAAPALLGTRETARSYFTEEGLTNGTEYAFVVTAVNGSGESVASTTISAIPGPFKALTAGTWHSCAVDAAGGAWCWGFNAAGQLGDGSGSLKRLAPVASQAGMLWKTLAAGVDHTCGIGVDESVSCWGVGMLGPLAVAAPVRARPVPRADQWLSLASGNSSGCASKGDGTLWCWGVARDAASPLTRLGGFASDWLDVSMAGSWRCARKQDRTAWCWDLSGSAATPTMVDSPRQWSKLAHDPKGAHNCAIDSNSKLWCWGSNWRGQLGVGDLADRLLPVAVAGDAQWHDVAAGGAHTCAVKLDASLWCWGDNTDGQLGIETRGDQVVPVNVGAGAAWSQVVAGDRFTCAMRRDGTIWCAGSNGLGQLGTGASIHAAAPQPALTDAVTIAATDAMSCAILRDGKTWCWGAVGPLSSEDPNAWRYQAWRFPVLVDETREFTRLLPLSDAGMCAVDRDGALWCWGPTDDPSVTTAMRRVAEPAAWERTAFADARICELREDATVWCTAEGARAEEGWSAPRARLLGGPQRWVQLLAGRSHFCALNDAKDIWCWGGNGMGQVGVPMGEDSLIVDAPVQVGSGRAWRSLAAGGDQTCAIADDGSLWCWGTLATRFFNPPGIPRGSLDPPVPGPSSEPVYSPRRVGMDADWAAVQGSATRMCATKTDGTLWCWGYAYDFGAERWPDSFSDAMLLPQRVDESTGWKSAASGYGHSCGLRTDGAVYCWGGNDRGQVGDGRAWSPAWQQVKFANP